MSKSLTYGLREDGNDARIIGVSTQTLSTETLLLAKHSITSNEGIEKLAAMQAQCVSLIRQMESNNKAIRKLAGATIMCSIPEDRELLKIKMAALGDDTYLKVNLIQSLTVQISLYNEKDDEEIPLLKQQILNAINVEYVEALSNFFKIYIKTDSQRRKLAQVQYLSLHPGATEAELRDIEGDDVEQILQQAVTGKYDDTRQAALSALSYVKKKHAGIVKCERGILDVQQILNMVAIFAFAQSELIKQMEENVVHAKDQVQAGVIQLKEVKKLQF